MTNEEMDALLMIDPEQVLEQMRREQTPEQKLFAQTGKWKPDSRSRHILSPDEWDTILKP